MATIVVNPQALQEEPTSELINLQISVEDEDWKGYFDQVQIFRSRESSAGPYEELTGPQMHAAQVPAYAGAASGVTGASAALVGKTLELRVNQKDDVIVTFTGVDPLTFAAAATQVTTQGRRKVTAWVDAEGQFVVSTFDVGTGAVLEVLGGDAAPALGLPVAPPANLDYGEDARIPLQAGKEQYLFTDIRGSRSFFYKTRFYNKTNGAKSDYSQAFSSEQSVGISVAHLVRGHVCLVDVDGRPLSKRVVQIHTEYVGRVIDGKTVAGGSKIQYTDDAGRAEFTLVRGQLYVVALPGTDLNRQFTAPTDPTVTSFNLLDAAVSTGQDMFRVAVPDLVVAERRTL